LCAGFLRIVFALVMLMGISHIKTVAITDGADTAVVRPSDWNSAHAYTLQDAVSISGNTDGVLANISSGTLYLAGGNNITLSQNGNSVTLSGPHTSQFLTTAMASNRGTDFVQATAAFAGTSASGTIASDGISVSIGPYITTAMASNRGTDFVQAAAAFAGTSASGTIASGGISVSIGPYLTTAMLSNAATISNIRVSAGTTSNLLSALTFSNGSGVSFGINASVITASVDAGAPSPINFSAGTTSNNLGSVVFSNSNGVSFGLNGSTITGSHNALTSQSNQVASAANGSFAFQTITFSNANGISFGTSAGSAITGSHNALTTAAASDHSHGNPTLALTNLSGTTASASNGLTLSLSAAAGGPGGAVPTLSIWDNLPMPAISGSIQLTNIAVSNGTLWLFPLHQMNVGYFPGNMTVSTVMIQMSNNSSSNNTAAQTQRYSFIIYTRANATSLNTIFSASTSWTNGATSQSSLIHGVRWLTFHSSQFNVAPTFSQTEYYGALLGFSSGASRSQAWFGARVGHSVNLSGTVGAASASANSRGDIPWLGFRTVSFTTAVPAGLAMADVAHTGSGYGMAIPHIVFNNLANAY